MVSAEEIALQNAACTLLPFSIDTISCGTFVNIAGTFPTFSVDSENDWSLTLRHIIYSFKNSHKKQNALYRNY